MSLNLPNLTSPIQSRRAQAKGQPAPTGSTQSQTTVHFGSDKVESSKKAKQTTDQTTQHPDVQPKRSLTKALGAGLKEAFNPWGLGRDLLFGTIASVVLAVIPPHVHALAILPSWMAVGAAIRGVQGAAQAYSGHTI